MGRWQIYIIVASFVADLFYTTVKLIEKGYQQLIQHQYNHMVAVILCSLIVSIIPAHVHASPNIGVNHVVLLWLKPETGPNTAEKIIQLTKQLQNISGVQQLQVGRSISSNRKIVDASFDIGIYMRFNNTDEMNTYLKHPQHVELVEKHIKPNITKIVVYDF